LDVKRVNFVHAIGADGPETVKLINFDKSAILPETQPKWKKHFSTETVGIGINAKLKNSYFIN
jgi:hypothetical protein